MAWGRQTRNTRTRHETLRMLQQPTCSCRCMHSLAVTVPPPSARLCMYCAARMARQGVCRNHGTPRARSKRFVPPSTPCMGVPIFSFPGTLENDTNPLYGFRAFRHCCACRRCRCRSCHRRRRRHVFFIQTHLSPLSVSCLKCL